MPYIDNLEEIKEKLDPESVLNLIQPGKSIKRHGKELRTCCPVHGGDGPENFSINLDTHTWYCHSKGCKGTSLVDLYAQSKDKPFMDATEDLAEQFRIPIEYKTGDRSKKRKTSAKANPGRLRDNAKKGPLKPRKAISKPKYTLEDVERSWSAAKPQGVDNYFSKKKLQPPPIARFGKNPNGYESTLIPYKDIEGALNAILSINAGGKFVYKITAAKKGSFALLGEFLSEGEFYIGEGIATVQTPWESTERVIPAVSCGSWSNILPCLTDIKIKYPKAKPIVLIDNDKDEHSLKAAKEIHKKIPDATFRRPSFEGIPNPENKELKDFNDIISICGQPLSEVKKQLNIEYKMPETTLQNEAQKETTDGFHEKLGKILGDANFAKQLVGWDYDAFEQEHKKLFAGGGLITGYSAVDDKLYFSKGDFVVVQGMSNHGKSTLMLQLASRFLSEKKNTNKKPMCIYLTYESSPVAVEAKFLNLLSHEYQKETLITYNSQHEEKFLYPDKKDYFRTITTYNELQKSNGIVFLKRIPIENIESLIDIYKKEFPQRTIVLFLDYIQIIDGVDDMDGWQRIKKIAYELEKLAISKEVIIITASQVNDNRQAREGRDIYNAATTVIDVFNHSHASLLTNALMKAEYRGSKGNKSICTFAAVKQKHGESFTLREHLLFNGFYFEENKTKNFQL